MLRLGPNFFSSAVTKGANCSKILSMGFLAKTMNNLILTVKPCHSCSG